MNKEITETRELKTKLLRKVNELDEKLDEVAIANTISEYADVDELRKSLCNKKIKGNRVNLHGFKAFSKLLRLFPENTTLYGFGKGSWWGGSHPCIFHHYLLLLDEQTPLIILFEEKYKSDRGENQRFHSTTFSIRAYAGEGKINISVGRGIWPDTNLISIVDSSNNEKVFEFLVRGDYSSIDGKCVSDIIKPIDLANFVQKDGEEYQLQKVKRTKK